MREYGCKGKLRYSSPKEALRWLKFKRRKDDTRGKAYKCRHCHGWHTASDL